jgi:hypothetical protein
MEVAGLVLPVFAIIATGWLAGWLVYISRSLADGLVHFAYNVAMPALLIVTISQEPARNLLEWRFLLAFGGGSILCFALVFLALRAGLGRDLASSTMYGMTAAMTNTGIRRAPDPALYLRPARRSARGRRHHIRGGRDVPRDRCPPGKRQSWRARVFNPQRRPAEADRAQSDGAINPDWLGLGDWRLADSDAGRSLFEYLRGRNHALRALCDRAWPVGRRSALEFHSVGRARGCEARDHALGRLRNLCGFRPQSALHDCCRRLCRGADRQNCVYPSRRIPGRGGVGRGHGVDHHALLGRDIAGLDLLPFGTAGTRELARNDFPCRVD